MRKTVIVTIDAPGRDHSKIFHIRELPASQAEAWGTRLMLALSRAGVDVPEGFFDMGMAGVAAMGLKAMGGLSWDVAKPLMDEMLTCIQIQPSASNPTVVRALIEDDIEEVATRLRLREEVITIHTGFSVRAFVSNFRKLQEAQAIRAAQMMTESGEDTATSEQPLDELSPAGLPH